MHGMKALHDGADPSEMIRRQSRPRLIRHAPVVRHAQEGRPRVSRRSAATSMQRQSEKRGLTVADVLSWRLL